MCGDYMRAQERETRAPLDLLGSAELAELDPDGSRPLEGMHGLCGRRFDCFDPVCSAAVGVGAGILPSAGIEFLPREDALISQGHPSSRGDMGVLAHPT